LSWLSYRQFDVREDKRLSNVNNFGAVN